jgi:DNA-binding NarL/FixJ family response regulator
LVSDASFSSSEGTMPRESPFAIRLTREERQVLETRSRQYTLPYRDVVRAKIVLLAADGLENKEIGERLDMPRPVVSKWRKRFFRERLAGLEERPRRGRPSGFSPSPRRGRESDRV